MKVYVGFDPREAVAYEVAVSSLLRHSSIPLEVIPLRAERLMSHGLLERPTDHRAGIYDIISNAPCATQFAISRFFVPHLSQTGFALFMDCDMVVLADVAELFALADPKYAVQVVKHAYSPVGVQKMDGVVQTRYSRKNWSSLILWNCDHSANLRLTIHDVNHRRGIELHQFYWLDEKDIGDLPAAWNWLVGEQPTPDVPKIAHFTNGGPFLPDWQPHQHDDIWLAAKEAV